MPDASDSPLALAAAPAPSRASTPLPGHFRPAPRTVDRDLTRCRRSSEGPRSRLFRHHPTGHELVARWRAGDLSATAVPARLLARRFVSAGVFIPEPRATTSRSRRRHGRRAGAQPPRTARIDFSTHSPACRASSWTMRPPSPARARTSRNATAQLCRPHDELGTFSGTQRRADPCRHRGRSLSSTPIACPLTGWLQPLLGFFDDPLVAAVAPRVLSPPERTSRARPVRTSFAPSLDQGRNAAPVRPGGPSPTSRAQRSSCAPTSPRPGPLRPVLARR